MLHPNSTVGAKELSIHLKCKKNGILDMPRMDGRQLLARLPEIRPMPATLVISGYLDPVVEEELGGHPAVRHVLRKPFDVLAFAGLVASAAGTGSTAVGGS